MLLTKIPHFHDVILMSFKCPHCQYENCDVQSAGEIHEKGLKYTLILDSPEDLDRAIMISDTARFSVKEFEIEKQPSTGQVSSVEGMLDKMVEDMHRVLRTMAEDLHRDEIPTARADTETIGKITDLIYKIKSLSMGKFPATIILDDPAGNAWLERLPTDTGKKFFRESYERTLEQNKDLGIGVAQDSASGEGKIEANPDDELGGIKDGLMYSLHSLCPGCTNPTTINYHSMDIPHFKQVVISATNCSHCGYRTNDITTGGAVPEKGQRIWLEVRQPVDLHRDILKSETCELRIPECELDVVPGTMGGRFTTVEGLLTQVRDDLRKTVFDFGSDDEEETDSLPQEKKDVWGIFFRRLNKAINCEMEYTIVLEDPFSNSYVQSLTSPDPDPQIRVEEYERTPEDEEELGLADMKTRLGPDGEYVRDLPDAAKDSLASEAVGDDERELKDEAPEIAGEAEGKKPEVAAESKNTEQKVAAENKVQEPEAAGESKSEGHEAINETPAYVARFLQSVMKPRETEDHAS